MINIQDGRQTCVLRNVKQYHDFAIIRTMWMLVWYIIRFLESRKSTYTIMLQRMLQNTSGTFIGRKSKMAASRIVSFFTILYHYSWLCQNDSMSVKYNVLGVGECNEHYHSIILRDIFIYIQDGRQQCVLRNFKQYYNFVTNRAI